MSVVRMLIVTALSVLALGALASPASAGIWTPIDSGTTENITAIDYQGGDRFWLATAGGSIRYREGGVFKPATGAGLPTGLPFNDIAFQPGTNIGLAVGNSDNVWRTTDGGRTWLKLDPKTINNAFCNSGGSPTLVDPGDMFAIAWGPNNVVYLGGANNTVLRSPGTAGLTFSEVNKSPTACQFDADGTSDIFFFPNAASRNDEKLFFQAREAFGQIYFTTDGLLSAASPRASSINGTETNTNMAVDPTNTNRMWSTNQCGFTCLYRSEDGAANFDCVCTLKNENSENQIAWYDVEYSGGTVLVAGRGGQIANSIDGLNFFYNKADGSLATKDWAAAALASGSSAAVGGQGGTLVVTDAAATVPDIIKPTGLIVGPNTGQVGQPLTFTAQVADEAGGSGIDPTGYSWTSAGLPGATGASATLTFPNAGFYTVRLSFRDLAGNVEEAFKSVSVSAAAVGPTATPTFSLSGPGNTATAQIIGNQVRVRMRGTIRPPAGVSTAAACNGKVRLTIKKKRKTLHRSRTALKLRNGKCRFGKTVFLARSKVGRNTTRLRLKVSFPGNSILKAGQTTKTLIIRQ